MNATGALPVANFTGMNLANPQNLSVTAIKPDNKTPMVEEWSLQVQHELPQSVVVSAGYVGAAGHRLVDRYNIANQLFNTQSGTHLYPGMGRSEEHTSELQSLRHLV